MRAILLVLALLVLVAIALVATNIVDIDWNGEAEAPVQVGINTPEIKAGTTNVEIPTPQISVPDGDNAAVANGQ